MTGWDWRAAVVLRTVLAGATRAYLSRQPRPARDGHVVSVGLDPIRVLVVGGGLAVGYGVERESESLDGALAAVLGEATHRGVVVDNRARPALPLAETIRMLGEVGAHTYQVVVWSPTFAEASRGFLTDRWRRELVAIVEHLRRTGGPDLRIVLLSIPAPEPLGRMEAITIAQVTRINTRIAAVAARFPLTRYVEAPDHQGRITLDTKLFTADYYRRTAAAVSRALLDLPGTRPDAGARAATTGGEPTPGS